MTRYPISSLLPLGFVLGAGIRYPAPMAVDNCPHSFQHLARVIVAAHLKRMRKALTKPVPMATFITAGQGKTGCIKHLKLAGDFPGSYLLIDAGKPFYVGIARRVIARLMQHARGDTANSSTLAYKMASARSPHNMDRHVAMMDDDFIVSFKAARDHICKMDVAFIEIACPVELYAFELACAMEFDTHRYNSFRIR